MKSNFGTPQHSMYTLYRGEIGATAQPKQNPGRTLLRHVI